ncbi:MAG: UDP-3-O-(3-hydroxymyristoyl)glucosamine N-acyltransferase [Deltaproteobacteria bacterium]|jgi:UDP-3-O-[3-hydroxymyristoyl] glucosamine N-acyltransferase|nr:UDP-3-O-(3-hydroxymyristoyl)glucosamine N-acyltransferase [Deltaproteobacteria bacterium]
MLEIAPRPLGELLAEARESLARGLAAAGGGEAPAYTVAGDQDLTVRWLCAFKEKAPPGALTFAVKAKYLAEAAAAGASAVLTSPGLDAALPEGPARPSLVTTPDPRLLFVAVLELADRALRPAFAQAEPFWKDRASVELGEGVAFGPGCYVGAGARIGRGARIGPGVIIEDEVTIGPGSEIHPRAIIRWRVRIGARCIIQPGAVIGGDGFGYTQAPDPAAGRLIHYKNPHLGSVTIEDDVEIGANTCVDRGLVADTVIRRGTKLDNLVQVGHNCEIGRDCILVSQAGAAGHSAIGDRAFILGQAGLSHGAKVGADAVITGQTGVTGEIPPGRKAWGGTPSIPLDEELKAQALARRFLPRLRAFLEHFRKSASFEELKERFQDRGDGRK